jgi:pyrroloquinoline-quinone synthase
MRSKAELRIELDAVVAERPLLEHPFYKAWADGTLTTEDLSFYSTQYWRQVEAFPGYLESVARRMPAGPARDIVTSNLRDERDDDHPRLWLDFANALGVSDGEVHSSGPEPETFSCVVSFEDAASSKTIPFALGMLYGYESQTPEVAETKVSGLREHYGIDGSPVEYFRLHGDLDVKHSSEMVDALSSVIRDEKDEAQAVEGARAGAQAIASLLDGVARVRGIS